VQSQTHPGVEHLLVVDGPDRATAARDRLSGASLGRRTLHAMTLPYATGREKWMGHRIYGACSFLCNTEFIGYLDEDNWLDADHVESLLAAIGAAGPSWGFALRKIVDEKGTFVTRDECESLGNLHPVFADDRVNHIDTNCYMLSRGLAVKVAHLWYAPARTPGLREGDAAICRFLLDHYPNPACSRRHTVNYTAGNRPDSVKVDFFLRGNQAMRHRYPQGMPWARH
jgi:hypothetical protein